MAPPMQWPTSGITDLPIEMAKFKRGEGVRRNY